MIICFNGVDGSGKSFQAQRLVKRLNEASYPAVHIWCGGRSSLTKPLIWSVQRVLRAPSKAQLKPETATEVGQQYREYMSSMHKIFKYRALRNVWLNISLLEHALEIWTTVLPHLLQGRIVVCDRYIYDTVISIAVQAKLSPAELAPLLRLTKLYPVPALDTWFFIDVPAEVAFHRKDDIYDISFLERRVPLYRAMASILGLQTIDGTADPDTITELIWHHIQPLLPTASTAALNRQ